MTGRQTAVLAALSAGPAGADYAPVQVQKLFFLIDENVARDLGGKLFHFEPYNYGPYDADVYRDLEALKDLGLVSIDGSGGRRRYALTAEGLDRGKIALTQVPPSVADYFMRAAEWVKSLSFADLVGSIYKAFPAMRANSIFVG